MNWFSFILLSLAVFRLTRLIVYDQITSFLRSPFMEEVEETNEEGLSEVFLIPRAHGFRGWIGQLISCYWCTGIWASIFLLALKWTVPNVGDPLILLFAVAGLAAIFETIIQAIKLD
ncbi:DUF1360 domain-containing protein [Bacillus niameyensis]|uniref:DUF1360 domain-containing protein n=1 Tax=Bacillus niameyensis TaxID=1522308 RepID=UPI00078384B2|nr:DUF1360 domain-containing protein [Bacillus niameyensis]